MRHALAFGVLLAVIGAAGGAKAQNYPWCEYLGGEIGGGRNCGFISFEQCMASALGNGSDCRPNTTYTPPPGPHDQMRSGAMPAPVHHHGRRKPAKLHKSS
jgi:hypothetical protein